MTSRWLLGGAALVAILAGAFYWTSIKRCDGLGCIRFKGQESLHIKEVYEDNAKTYRALWTDGRMLVRVEKYNAVTPDQAKLNNEYKSMQIASLYEDAKSPYPGVLSDRIKCEGKYKIGFREEKGAGADLLVYEGFLNDRMQYGTCIEDQLLYRSRAAMFYCGRQKAWYQMEFITRLSDRPQPDLGAYIGSIICR